MNTSTLATLPFVLQSVLHPPTDLLQSFVQDPAVGLPSVPGLVFGPIEPFGSDSTYKGTLSQAEIEQRTQGPMTSWAGFR